jgi:uncharacterized hydrophobic protein (TIGR00271 family)
VKNLLLHRRRAVAEDGAVAHHALQAVVGGAERTVARMVHLRIVAPFATSSAALDVLEGCRSVTNVIALPSAARRPEGDVILCDVAREDASVVIQDLRGLGIEQKGSITLELIDTAISQGAKDAVARAEGAPSDAVIWEEVTARTSETAELSGAFLAFMVLAALIAAVGIYLDSAILVVGAMVVAPEFGPMAGFCVAAVRRRPGLAAKSFVALAVGFPMAIGAAYVTSLVFRATGITPEAFTAAGHSLASTIASPNFLAGFVAFCAGVAGMLSLTTAKSGALIGVLISITTIPAAANVGVAAAYHDWDGFSGSLGQLGLNLAMLLVAGTLTLVVQRALYARRRAAYARRRARRRRRRDDVTRRTEAGRGRARAGGRRLHLLSRPMTRRRSA